MDLASQVALKRSCVSVLYLCFTWLMFGAAIVFTIVACFYKGRTYLQSQLTLD